MRRYDAHRRNLSKIRETEQHMDQQKSINYKKQELQMNEAREYKNQQLKSEIDSLRETSASKRKPKRRTPSRRKKPNQKFYSKDPKGEKIFDGMDQQIAYTHLMKERKKLIGNQNMSNQANASQSQKFKSNQGTFKSKTQDSSPEKLILSSTDDRELMEKELAKIFQDKEHLKLELAEALDREVKTKKVNQKNKQFRKSELKKSKMKTKLFDSMMRVRENTMSPIDKRDSEELMNGFVHLETLEESPEEEQHWDPINLSTNQRKQRKKKPPQKPKLTMKEKACATIPVHPLNLKQHGESSEIHKYYNKIKNKRERRKWDLNDDQSQHSTTLNQTDLDILLKKAKLNNEDSKIEEMIAMMYSRGSQQPEHFSRDTYRSRRHSSRDRAYSSDNFDLNDELSKAKEVRASMLQQALHRNKGANGNRSYSPPHIKDPYKINDLNSPLGTRRGTKYMGDWGKQNYVSPYSIKQLKSSQKANFNLRTLRERDLQEPKKQPKRYRFRNPGPSFHPHNSPDFDMGKLIKGLPEGFMVSNLSSLHTDELMKYYQEIIHKGKRDLIDHQRKSTMIKKIDPYYYQ